jgi:phage terminase large subunit
MIEGEQTRCYSITQLGSINLRDLYMRWAWFECEAQVKHEAYIESLEMAQEFEDHAIAFTTNSNARVVFRYPA